MSANSDSFDSGFGLGIVVGLIIGFFISFTCYQLYGMKYEKSAIDAGVAEYYLDQNHQRQFRYLPKK